MPVAVQVVLAVGAVIVGVVIAFGFIDLVSDHVFSQAIAARIRNK